MLFLHGIFYHIAPEKKSVFIYNFAFFRYNHGIGNKEAAMPQDAFTLRLNAKELCGTLTGGRINKIVQPSKDEVFFIIYTGKRTVKLILNTNAQDCGAYFGEDGEEPPLVAPNFCMLLRKRLQSAEICGVELVGFERILRFKLRSFSDFTEAERDLYLEVMGKYSNLILVENGIILGALKTTALDGGARRTIFSGAKYVLPAPQDKADPSDGAALRAVLQGASGDLGKFLFTRVSGLAPSTAEAIAGSYAGGGLCEHVQRYIFSDMVCPCVVERDGKPVDFYARSVEGGISFPTLSEAQTYFYARRRAFKRDNAERRRLLTAVQTAVKKHEKRLAQILEKKKECADCESLRIKGELLTANLYALTRGMEGCELSDFYDEKGGTVKIKLDAQLTPSQNAQSYFKRYRKQKRTLEMLAPQEAETEAELEYLESLKAAILSAESGVDLLSCAEELETAALLKVREEKRKRAKPEIPFRTFECGGFQVYAGRNNLQNDALLRRAAPEDIWLHAQRYHSCHVIIRTNGRSPSDMVLAFAANVCAKYSDANGDRIPVDYAFVKYVKKPPKAKAGFVVYTNFSTLLGDPSKV